MPTIKLQQVKNFDKLLKYLETELGWPVEGREIDDIAFPFDLETDLGLDKNEVAKVRHVYRLKKMHKKQPFGIFFVDFEGKKMPVSVLKRILRNLALKRKANAKAADQLAWDVEDLIFISAVGEEKDSTREISFAHFRKEPDNRHVLKVLAWDGGDTPLKMDYLDERLHECLRFPDDANDVEAWRKSWTAAFRTGLRQNIRRSEELAQALAALAMRINKEALSLIKKESVNGPLKTLHAGFKDALIHDLTEEAFTDCYAQTITYGLLTAAITKVNQAGVKDLTSTSVLEMVPSTNPFLKDILSSFLEAGGRGEKGIDFDDLGVQDVIDLLRAESTDLPNILRDFGNLTQDEDPVIHFYETFLKIYNKDERVKRGAFYTPRPVVSYIVRSVDELLRKKFGLEDGLADTTTWGEMIKRNPAIKLPPLTDNPGEKKTIKETEPFVQILDPATGTATFLVEVINIIEKTVKAKAWAKLNKGPYDHDQHSKREEVLKAWNQYVPEHLLKRLHAYELMMAPYVIAHMKVGLKLSETGYRFATEERARIYLTNALEPAKEFNDRLNFEVPALALEAKEVNRRKEEGIFTVILGNPPYSKKSGNLSEDAVSLINPFRYVRGEKITARGALALELNLQDDYVKFYGLMYKLLRRLTVGVGAYITNSGYLETPSLRGLRCAMYDISKEVSLINLGGRVADRARLKETDDNVFDIEQGVAIGLYCLSPVGHDSARSLRYKRILGSRLEKNALLNGASASGVGFSEINVKPDQFKYSNNTDPAIDSEFEGYLPLNQIFNINSGGIITSRDSISIGLRKNELLAVVDRFAKLPKGDKSLEEELGYSVKAKWDVEACKAGIAAIKKRADYAQKITFKPFDVRWIFYYIPLIDTPSRPVSQMVYDGRENLILLSPSVKTTDEFCHAFISSFPAVNKACSHDMASQMFPLFVYDSLSLEPSLNVSKTVIDFLSKMSIARDNLEAQGRAFLGYVYAVLYSSGYRNRYGKQLKTGFARIPLTVSKGLFAELSNAGLKLVSIHKNATSLPEETVAGVSGFILDTFNFNENANCVEIYSEAKMEISIMLPRSVWDYQIGGYQICHKWLKDRKRLKMTKANVDSYREIICAIQATIESSASIDEIIDLHGGWPKAFQ